MRPSPVRRRTRVASRLLALLAVAGAVACSDSSSIGPRAITTLRIVPDSVNLVAGTSDSLSAFPLDQDGAFIPNRHVAWSSNNPLVADVDSTGRVTAVAVGTTQILAVTGSVSSTATVVVTPAPIIATAVDTIFLSAIASSGATPGDTIGISNSGGGSLSGLAVGIITYGAGPANWLTAQLDQNLAPANLGVQAAIGALPIGQYVAHVPITDPQATNSPADVTVVLDLIGGPAALIALQAGNNQSAPVGTAVPVAPAVIVTDQFGNPVAGISVTFAVTGGGGSLTGATAATGANGIAAVGRWTLGTAVGANTLTASVTGLGGSPVSFTATAVAGAASAVAISGGNNQTTIAGQTVPLPPSVLVTDIGGNPVSGASVTFAVATGGGSVTGATQTTNASGIATVSSWTLGTTVGANTLTATAAGVATAVTFSATGTAGPAAALAINAGNNQTAPVATAVAVAPSVKVTDLNGNAVSGVAVNFAVTAGGGTLTGASPSTNASGIATLGSWTLGPTAGAASNTLQVTATGVAGSVSFSASSTAGAATTIALDAGNNQTATVGTAVAVPPSVLVTDAGGNPVGGVSVTFAVTAGGGTRTGGAQVTNASGIATVGSWTLGGAAGTGNNTLTATSAGLTGSPVTFTASATAGNAGSIVLNTGNNQTATVGTAVATDPSVLVTDAGGNPVSGVSVTFAVASGGGSVTGGTQTTNASGIATVTSWALGTATGSNTLTATSAGLVGSPVTFTATGVAGAAATIAISLGNNQTAAAGTAVAIAPAALVTDQFGNPVSGTTVTFAVVSGGGSVTAPAPVSNASGLATLGSWTLGTTVGANTLSATAAGLAGSPLAFSATGAAGAATTIALNAGNSQTATVGTPVAVAPSVKVTDVNGNAVSGVSVTFAATAGGGSVTGGSQVTNASGIATVGSWTLGPVAGTANNTLTATSAGLTGSPVSFTASGTAGGAGSIALNAGNNQTATVATAVATDPSVLVTDGGGNPVSGVSVTFAVTGGGGSVTGGSQLTNASGIATVTSWTLGNLAGANTLTATSAGLVGSPVTFSATGTAGAATTFAISAGNGQSAAVGQVVAVAPAALVTDQFGNGVAGVTVSFAVTGGGGSVTGAAPVSNASGIATLGSWTLGPSAGANSLSATASGLTGSPLSFTATANAGAATTIALNAGNNQTATVGSAVAVAPSVLVTDGGGNPVSGVSVTFAVTGGGGSVTGGSATTNASGLATVTGWTLGGTAGTGNNTLTATSAGLTGSPVTFTASATAGAAATIALNAGSGQSATVGTAVATDPSVLVTDAGGNPVGGVSVTFAVTGGGGSVVGGAATTSASGIATVTSWTLGTTAGANTLSATSAGLGGSPVGFSATGTAGAATTIAVSAGNNQSAVAGQAVAIDPAALVTDQFGNPVSGVAVTFAVTGGGGSVTGGSTSTNAGGLATVGSWTLGTTVGANTLTASAAGLAGSPLGFSATGTVGAAAILAKNAGDNQAAAVSSTVPVAPAVLVTDVNGNPVSGVSVTFAVGLGGGSLTGGSTTTNASGIATVGSWTLGAATGANTLTATSAGLTGSPATFNATANAGNATTIALSAGNGQSATVGTTLPTALAVLVTDAAVNPVAGFTVSWTASNGGSVDCGGGPLPSCSSPTNGSGIATATWTLGTSAGAQGTTAAAGGLAGSPINFSATANAGAAATLAINGGDNQSATVSTSVATAPSVLVTDAFGNPVSGVAVSFAVAGGGGSVTGGSTSTNASGIATVTSWTLGATAGANTLTATSAGLTGSPATFHATGTAGAAANIALNAGNGQSATVGNAVAINPSVLVTDAGGNPVSGATVTFIVTGGGGSLTGAAPLTNASGIATVGSWTLGPLAGSNNNTVQASTAGVGGTVTFAASATAGSASSIALNAGNNQSATVNTAVATAPSVLVTDAGGNPVSGISVTFAVTGGGGSVTGGSTTTNASGIATVGSWTLGTTAGSNTLSATSAGLAGSPVGFTATGTAAAAASIALNAGNGQSATVGTAVAIDPSVIVRDAFNNPVSGVSVTFAVTGGGGSVTGGSTTSNASGIATVGSWTLGGSAGANSLNATSAGLAGSPVSFSATATAGGATTIALNAGNGQSATVNTPVAINPSVLVTDALGNPVSGVSVTFAVTGGGGIVSGGAASTNGSGIATVTSWTLGTTAGSNTLQATSAGLAGSPVVFTATGTAAAAASVVLNSGNNQSATVNTAVATAPSVLVTDAFGNAVSGVSVTFAVTGGGGGVTGGSTTTNGSGIATVGSWTLGTTAGSNTLSATSAGLAGSPVGFTATGTAGAASSIALNAGNGQSATVGTAVAINPSVIVRDAFSNPVNGVSVTFAVTGGGGSVTGGSTTTNASGIATVSKWTLGSSVGANSLSASSTGLSGSPVGFSATGTAGGATTIALNAGNGQSATVNTTVAINPSVLVTDQFGNPVSGVSVTFAVTGGGGSVTGGSQSTNASGIATVTSWTLGTTAGSNSLQATSAGLTGSPVAFSATATAGSAASLALNAGNGQSATVNTAVATAPSVIVRDAFSNAVSGVSVSFAVTGGGGSVLGGSATTNASGIATVTSWTLGTTAGSNTLSATSVGLSGSPVGFTATGTAAAASSIAINAGNNQTATVNTNVATAPSVVVRDAFSNPVSGVSVTFAVSGGGGSVVGGAASTNASGIATVTSWKLGTTAGSNSLSATSAGLSGSPQSFTAAGTAGAATTVAVNAGNSQTATVNTAVATAPSVIVRDAFSNPVSGVGVTFAVTGGAGSVTGASQSTNASGIATVASWTLGTVAGTSNNTLTGTASGIVTPATFTASGTAGAATQIALNAGNNQTATVNTAVAIDPSVIVRDAFNNVVSGKSVTFAVTAGGGSATGTAAVSNASGIATVTSWTLGTASGTNNNTMTATSAGLTGSPVTFTASSNPGAVTQVAVFLGNNQSARPGTAVSTDPSVSTRDAFGNSVCGATVTFSVTAGNGSATGTSTTSSCGFFGAIATVGSWTLGSSGLPTAGAPTGGHYSNTLHVVSGSGSVDFTAFGTWSFASDIAPIFTTNSQGSCNGCHSVGNFGTYANIVNKAAVDNPGCGTLVVTTGSTASSFLFSKIQHTQSAGCGGSMPALAGSPFLTTTERNKIRDWILNSAPNN